MEDELEETWQRLRELVGTADLDEVLQLTGMLFYDRFKWQVDFSRLSAIANVRNETVLELYGKDCDGLLRAARWAAGLPPE